MGWGGGGGVERAGEQKHIQRKIRVMGNRGGWIKQNKRM